MSKRYEDIYTQNYMTNTALETVMRVMRIPNIQRIF